MTSSGLFDEIKARVSDGMPVFGTCAGMILLATEVLDGRPDQRSFGAIDVTVRRNGYGRQLDSFETDLDVAGLDAPVPRRVHPGAAGRVGRPGRRGARRRTTAIPVLVRQGRVMAAVVPSRADGRPPPARALRRARATIHDEQER